MGFELGLGLGSTPNPNPKPSQVQWAAPEVLLGQSYSHTCDVWSFGVVCWELSTARKITLMAILMLLPLP